MQNQEVQLKNARRKTKVPALAWFLTVIGICALSASAGISYYSNKIQVSAENTSADTALSGDWQLGLKKYSGTSVTSVKPSSDDCEKSKTGQVVILTDIDLAKVSGDVETALMNTTTWTKRGKLYGLDQEVIAEITKLAVKNDQLVEMAGSNSASDMQNKFYSGVLYKDVPAEQNLVASLYILSQYSQRGYSSVSTGAISPLKPCETRFIYVKKDDPATKKDNVVICVHGTDPANDYMPKKSFELPKYEVDKNKFLKDYPQSKIDLGLCQNDDAVKANVNAGKKPSDQPVGAVAPSGSGAGTGNGTGGEANALTGNGSQIGNTGQDPLSKGQAPAIGAAEILPNANTKVLPPKSAL